MNSINRDGLQLFKGNPLNVNDLCLVYFPTLGDIGDIGLETFQQYLSLLTMNKSEIFKNNEEEITEKTEINYFILMSLSTPELFNLAKKAFYFFTKEEIIFLPELYAIQIGDLKEKRLLYNEDFLLFQEYIRTVSYLDNSKAIKSSDSERVRKIKERIQKGQSLVAEIKAKQDSEDDVDAIDLVSSYLEVHAELIDTIWSMTYYAFQIQFRRMQMREEYMMNAKSAIAGAKIPKNKMKHWIRRIRNK